MLPLRFELASQLSLGLRHICFCHFVCRANSCHRKRRNTLVVRRNDLIISYIAYLRLLIF
ncbi:hypothetical protein EHQ57_10080 [Leptospira wolffii]|nr:hypothetical protein EHQ35_15075 [Leptospira wolffii]TGL29276.1 hypothetical protein EHQ57_10080 [Leptospira wolffii]